MGSIRVLHCIFSSGVGGLEAGVVKLVNHITAGDISHGICTFTDPGRDHASCFDDVANPHCRLFRLRRRCGNDVALIAQLMRVIRDFRPTVVHTRNWATYAEGALAAMLTATPVLIHGEHGTPSPGRWRHRWAYRLLARRTRVVVTVSEALSRLYHGMCKSWATEVRTIHNGVDEQRYVPASDLLAAKAALDLPPGARVIGSVGRLVPVKGFEVLLESMARIANQVPRALLLLVGEGPEQASLEAAARRLGITDRVRFAGHRAEVIPYYHAMDVYVNSSHSEGISNGILEALSCGVPVVGTAVGGTPEILCRVENGGGILVPPNDPDALAKTLIEHLEEGALGPQRRVAARQAILRHFSLERMIRQYESLYRDVTH